MREIKFRLKNSINKIVGYEKWYSGSLDSKNFYTANPCWLYSTDGKNWFPKPIQHRYKDQYTGLKDKKGKEIFEGDIVRVSSAIYKVIYQDCGFELACTGNRVNMFRNIEIIGNIVENPELLENGNHRI